MKKFAIISLAVCGFIFWNNFARADNQTLTIHGHVSSEMKSVRISLDTKMQSANSCWWVNDTGDGIGDTRCSGVQDSIGYLQATPDEDGNFDFTLDRNAFYEGILTFQTLTTDGVLGKGKLWISNLKHPNANGVNEPGWSFSDFRVRLDTKKTGAGNVFRMITTPEGKALLPQIPNYSHIDIDQAKINLTFIFEDVPLPDSHFNRQPE